MSEQVIADAVAQAHKTIVEVCDMIEELRQKVGVEKEIILVEDDPTFIQGFAAQIFDKLYELKQIRVKQQRNDAVNALFDQIITEYCDNADA